MRVEKHVAQAQVAEATGVPQNILAMEEALAKAVNLQQEISRLQFLARDAKIELVDRVVREGWIDLLTVKGAQLKRRIRHVKEPR